MRDSRFPAGSLSSCRDTLYNIFIQSIARNATTIKCNHNLALLKNYAPGSQRVNVDLPEETTSGRLLRKMF